MARGTKGFFIWLRDSMPDVYAEVARDFSKARMQNTAVSGLSGIGLIANTDPVAISTEQPPSKTLTQTIQDIANIAAQAYLTKEQLSAQRKILDMQLSRAQQGLPPLNIDPIKYGVPQPSVGVGLTGDTQRLLLYLAGGAALLFVGAQIMKR